MGKLYIHILLSVILLLSIRGSNSSKSIRKRTIFHKNPIFQRVFNRGPSESLSSAFFGHNSGENEEFNVFRIESGHNFGASEEENGIFTLHFVENESSEEDSEEDDAGQNRGGFRGLPQFERDSNFHPQIITHNSDPETHTTEIDSQTGSIYNGFSILPHYVKLENFHSGPVHHSQQPTNVPIFTSQPDVVQNSKKIIDFLPQHEKVTNFNSEQEPFTSAINVDVTTQTSIPQSAMEVKETMSPVYEGFKLLPMFDIWNQFNTNLFDTVNVKPVIQTKFKEVDGSKFVQSTLTTMDSMPKNENITIVNYNGFKLLPSYNPITNFKSNFNTVVVPVEEVINNSAKAEENIQNMPKLDNIENDKIVQYTGFKLLPTFDSYNSFLSQKSFKNPVEIVQVPETVQKFMNIDSKPNVTEQNVNYNGFKLLPGFNPAQQFDSVAPIIINQTPEGSPIIEEKFANEPETVFNGQPSFSNPSQRFQPSPAKVNDVSGVSSTPVQHTFRTLGVKVEPISSTASAQTTQSAPIRPNGHNSGRKVLVKVRKLSKESSGTPITLERFKIPPKHFPEEQSIRLPIVFRKDELKPMNLEQVSKHRFGKKLNRKFITSVADLPLDPHAIFDGEKLPNKNSFGEVIADMF